MLLPSAPCTDGSIRSRSIRILPRLREYAARLWLVGQVAVGTASRRALQVVVAILGTVALVFGLQTVLFGGAPILGVGDVPPSVDSELRFHAACYAGAGALLLWTVPRIETAGLIIRAVGVVVFIAGAARLLSLLTVGTPHTLYVVLMAIELVIPAVLIPWQTAVARSTT
jgi:hypothetical protein